MNSNAHYGPPPTSAYPSPPTSHPIYNLSPAPSHTRNPHPSSQPQTRPALSPLQAHKIAGGCYHPQPPRPTYSHHAQGGQGQAPHGSFERDPSLAPAQPVQVQPRPRAGMSAGGGAPYRTGKEGEFSAGLLECEGGGFCLACCCPCVTYGKNDQRLSHLVKHSTSHPFPSSTPSCCSTACVIYCCLGQCCLAPLLDCIAHGAARSHFSIQGNCAADCAVATFCGPCAAVQAGWEMKREEEHRARGGGPAGGGKPVMGDVPGLELIGSAMEGGEWAMDLAKP